MKRLRAQEDVEAVFCCVGGGGLLAGVAAFLKAVKPDIKAWLGYGISGVGERFKMFQGACLASLAACSCLLGPKVSPCFRSFVFSPIFC